MTRTSGACKLAKRVTAAAVVASLAATLWAQTPFSPYASNILRMQEDLRGAMVREVRISGAKTTPQADILRQVKTKAKRPLEMPILEDDVRRLVGMGRFLDVTPHASENDDGTIDVIFQVVERPTVNSVAIAGNRKAWSWNLFKQAGLREGDGLDPFSVEEARRRLEEHYRNKGFNDVEVTIAEGDRAGDRDVKFQINEGLCQRIGWVDFVGNTIVSDRRLKTQIKSKTPILYLFKGYVDEEVVNQDDERLEAYYRSLGYFRADVGHELQYDEDRKWTKLTFVINEGPRYHVRNVSFEGATVFSPEKLSENLELKPGDPFNQDDLNLDVAALTDLYGGLGYIDVVINPEPRLDDRPGEMDLVYHLVEGAPSRVRRIHVKLEGESPRTQRAVVLNQLTLHPGEIIDARKLRDSERRLLRAGIFDNDPINNSRPQIIVSDPLLPEIAEGGDSPYGDFRGQSPDPAESSPVERRPRWKTPLRWLLGGGE